MLEQLPLVRGIVTLSNDGGPFVIWIFAAGVLMWALIIERYWYFSMVLPKQSAALQAEWLARSDREGTRGLRIGHGHGYRGK